jgi:peptide/nickel transport system permease protein
MNPGKNPLPALDRLEDERVLEAATMRPSATPSDDEAFAHELGGDAELVVGAEPAPRSQIRLFVRRFLRHRMAVLSLIVLVLLYVAVFTAHLWAPFERNDQDLLNAKETPSGEHWFGTDTTGRDLFSEIMYAGQISLKIGVTVALLATVIGVTVGAIAGFFGRFVDTVLVWVTDLFLIVPGIAVLAIALKRFGQSDGTIILVLAGLAWMVIARVARGQVLALKQKEYVEAARAAGASSPRIIIRHLLPNMIGPIMVNATLAVAAAIIAESTLSFLGFGVQPPQTSWGNMLADAKGYSTGDKAYLVYFPSLAILITVMCINFLGDGLRDALDPQATR